MDYQKADSLSSRPETLSENTRKNIMSVENEYGDSANRNKNSIGLSSNDDAVSWCTKQTSSLEVKKNYAISNSNSALNDLNAAHNKSIVENDDDSENLIHLDDNQYQNCQSFSKVQPLDFEGDLYFFEQYKHPTIQEMLHISEETGVRYDQVFHRFNELRVLSEVKCTSNDTCERVMRYFNPKTVFNLAEIEKKISMMHKEFKNYGDKGPVICTGHVHLIVEKVQLPPDIIREYYLEWYANLNIKSLDLNTLITEEKIIYHEERERRDGHSTQSDHDYEQDEIPQDCKIRSLLRIIKQKPHLTVADAVVLSRLYKVDIKFIQKLIHQDDDVMFNVHHAAGNRSFIREQCIPMEKSPEIIHVSAVNTRDCKMESVEGTDNYDDSQESMNVIESPLFHFDGNDMVVAQYEDVVDSHSDVQVDILPQIKSECSDEKEYAYNSQEKSPNRFPEDFNYFKQNRHPSIREMIEISKKIKTTYRQVFYRFRDLRSAFKEPCHRDCICRKVLKLFAQRATFDGTLDSNSVRIIYQLFNEFGYVGKNPDIGYIHQVAERVDLPAFVVKDQYKDWLLETSDSDPMKLCKGLEDVHDDVLKEFRKDSELFYDRLSYLARRYGTSQKIILECHHSFNESIMRNQNIGGKQQNEMEDSNIGSDHCTKDHVESGDIDKKEKMKKQYLYEKSYGDVGDTIDSLSHSNVYTHSKKKARKITFNMNNIHSDVSSEVLLSNISTSECLTSSQKTDDEEIDIVGFDESSEKIPIDELSRTFVQSHPSIHEFPGDLDIFDENRHPSIQEMIDISQDVGIPYEEVFFRFQHLRKLKNEPCPIGDTCQKVEVFNKIYPVLNGKLDEESRNIMHKEFEKHYHFGPNLPVGYIHLIMDQVELPSRVIRMQYTEWYTKIRKNHKKLIRNHHNSTASSSSSNQTNRFNNNNSLKRKHEDN